MKWIKAQLVINEEDLTKDIVLIAENLGDYYRNNKDAVGAVKEAIRDYRKSMIEELDEKCETIYDNAVKQVSESWKE